MLGKQKLALSSLALVMSFRLMGLFMILPVFSLYTEKLQATPKQMGFALGVYGLTQALFQMPLGHLSDRIGRKPVILIGLSLFALGSLLASFSHTIMGVTLGRMLQGMGAVGSTILALVADLTKEEDRSKAMAIMGLAIGLSFSLAMIIGPIINHAFQLNGIFLTTFLLALISILLICTTLPSATPKLIPLIKKEKLKTILMNPQLFRLNFGILTSHAIFTATFFVIPLLLTEKYHLGAKQQIYFYILILLLSFLIMFPFIIIAEKKHKIKSFLLSAIFILIMAEFSLIVFKDSFPAFFIILFFFFTAFSFLEAILPSLVSKHAPAQYRGSAMGIYSTAQFLGIFIGGTLSGWIASYFKITGVLIFCIIIGCIWLLVTFPLKPYKIN